MAITGKVKTLFEDKERTQAVFPRTVFSAVTNEDGESMDELLTSAVCIGEDLTKTYPLSVNADTLGGQSPDYYAKASEVSTLPKAITKSVYKLSTTTGLETIYSVTIPQNCVYYAMAYARWSQGKPTSVAIASNGSVWAQSTTPDGGPKVTYFGETISGGVTLDFQGANSSLSSYSQIVVMVLYNAIS